MEEKIHIYSDESNHDKSITNKENNINIDNEVTLSQVFRVTNVEF